MVPSLGWPAPGPMPPTAVVQLRWFAPNTPRGVSQTAHPAALVLISSALSWCQSCTDNFRLCLLGGLTGGGKVWPCWLGCYGHSRTCHWGPSAGGGGICIEMALEVTGQLLRSWVEALTLACLSFVYIIHIFTIFNTCLKTNLTYRAHIYKY